MMRRFRLTDGRRWLQFSTKALLLFVLILSIPLAWLSVKRAERERQRVAVIEVEKLGGSVWYNWDPTQSDAPPGPRLLRAILGDDFFIDVEGITLRYRAELNDADIDPLEALSSVEHLSLDHTCITDAGLRHVRRMRRLKTLDLDETSITDVGIAQLKTMIRLERLEIRGTLVTAAGVAGLRSAIPACEIIRYDRTDGSNYGLAPIHDAAKAGDIDTIRDELKAGAAIDLRVSTIGDGGTWDDEWDGTTPLMWAASRGQVAAVRFLIGAGAEVNARSSEGVTPLMAAAGAVKTMDGNPLGCLELLLAAGARIADADQEGCTALFYACGKGTFFDEPPCAFLQPELRLPDPFRGIRPNAGPNIGARFSARRRFKDQRHGDVERVKRLLAAGADANSIDGEGVHILVATTYRADAERVRLLLGAGADIAWRGAECGSSLRAAAIAGDLKTFTMLLHAGAALESGLLYWAARSDDDAAEKVQLLIELGSRPDEKGENGRTPLICSLWGSSTAAPVLLRAGADARERNEKGESLLLLAAEHGPAEAVRLLLERGLDPNERSTQWDHPTALIAAAESQREAAEKVNWLLNSGAAIDAVDDRGATALLAASRAGNMQGVVVLAEAGAAVNIVEHRERMTPLLYVADRGGDECFMCEETGGRAARALIAHGADINAQNDRGETARELAERIHHAEVFQVLDEFGARLE